MYTGRGHVYRGYSIYTVSIHNVWLYECMYVGRMCMYVFRLRCHVLSWCPTFQVLPTATHQHSQTVPGPLTFTSSWYIRIHNDHELNLWYCSYMDVWYMYIYIHIYAEISIDGNIYYIRTYATATLVPFCQAPHGRCKAHRSAYHFPQQKMRFRDRQRFGKVWYRGFLKWWHPTTIDFPKKHDHFGVFWGYLYLLWSRWRLQISYISKPGSLGKWSNLTHIFQLSWNHHPDDIFVIFGCLEMRNSMEFPINICVSMHFFKWKTSWDLWTIDINT